MTKKTFSGLLGALFLFSPLFAAGCGGGAAGKSDIVIIAKGADSAFWKSVKSGADVAAVEYNVNLRFTAPATEEDAAFQQLLIDDAIEEKADAIVLSAIDYAGSGPYVEKAMNAGIPVVIFDSATQSQRPLVEIRIDDYAAGGASFKVLRAQTPGKLKIGIVNFLAETDNGQKREAGFRAAAEADGNAEILETRNVQSNIDAAAEGTKSLLEEYPGLNAVATFNEWTTLGVGKAITETKAAERVTAIGFDNNVVSVGQLESGELDALIVQNPYAMGYLGVENACRLIEGKIKKKTFIAIETITATRENMYDEDVAKLLFPF